MKDNRLHYKATKGYISNEMEKLTCDIEDVFHIYIDRMYNTENLFTPIIIEDLEKNPFSMRDTYNSWSKLTIKPTYELLTCGIGIGENIVGFIDIFNEAKDDKNLLKYLCYDIAIAFKNAELLENIMYMSKCNNLTGIYNRHYFGKLLNEALDKAKVSKESLVICTLDLNNFKEVNDNLGHDAGDKILVQYAKTFKTELCENDVFGRVGGDEFSVIFINKDKHQVKMITDKIYMAFKNEVLNFNEHTRKISFAYGLSQFQEDSVDVYELLKIADKRMYKQKRRMKELKK